MKLLFTSLDFNEKNIRLSVLLDDAGRPVLFDAPGEEPTIVGNIYIGRVASIVKGINAAFVEFLPGQMAFYRLDETGGIFVKRQREGRLSVGDELLVEITREASGPKTASCTGSLSFRDDYLLLTAGNGARGISKKITDPERRMELRRWLDERGTDAGIIVRTRAALASRETLEESYAQLTALYEDMKNKARHLVLYSALRRQKSDQLYLIESLSGDEIEEAVTDDSILFDELSKAELPFPVRLYDKSTPLPALYSVSTRLEEALARKVYMKSGAFLYIEPTQALTAIDVNSGKSSGDALSVNMEAAEEIMRQLSLRNLSGIIVIDFINMRCDDDYSQFLSRLTALCRDCRVETTVVGFTGLGLCEMTRKKTKKPLAEQLFG